MQPSWLKRLLVKTARNQGRDEEAADRFSYQRVSMAHMKGNAEMLYARKADTYPPEFDDL